MNRSHDPSALRRLWKDLRTTPLTDMLRGRLTGSLDLDRVIVAAAVPEQLNELIRRAVGLTRLSRGERFDVAGKLADRFRSGLASGQTPEELVASFGDPRSAARLIRRAKLRGRPLFWRLWRRGVQTMGVVAALAVGTYLFFAVRLFTAHPTISHNYRLDLIAPTQGVPEADRAWPFYREALLHLTPEPEIVKAETSPPADGAEPSEGAATDDTLEREAQTTRKMATDDIFDERPGSKHWEMAEKWLDENQAALAAARRGAAKPRFGFVYNDPADRAWLNSVHADSERMDPNVSGDLADWLLPQFPGLRPLARLLATDARRACARNDQAAFIGDAQAIIGIAKQLHDDLAISICFGTSMSIFRVALALVDETIAEHPEFLDDDGLRELAQCITDIAGGGRIVMRLEGDRLWALDFCQRTYSDNGRGDGVLTREGLALYKIWYDYLYSGYFQFIDERVRRAGVDEFVVGPAIAALSPSRRKMTEMTNEYFDRAEREFKRPLWQWADSNFTPGADLLHRLSAIDSIRYGPLVLIVGPLPGYYASSELLNQERDATLTALALNRFHRRHGKWPEHLTELVPDLPPAVPLDCFSGQPIGYHLAAGRPVIYSVGPDRTDDGGRSLDEPGAIWVIASHVAERDVAEPIPAGDWILWPPISDHAATEPAAAAQ
jgi:hypothetical protein